MEIGIIIVGVGANLVTTIVGVLVIVGRLEEASQWKGWADTKIRSNCNNIERHRDRLDDHETRIARHEGAAKPLEG